MREIGTVLEAKAFYPGGAVFAAAIAIVLGVAWFLVKKRGA